VKDRVIADPCIDIRLPKKPENSQDVRRRADRRRGRPAGRRARGRGGEVLVAADQRSLCSADVHGRVVGASVDEAIGLRICDLNMLRREVTFGRVVVNQNDSKPFLERGSKIDDWRTVPAPEPVTDMLAEHISKYVADPTDRDAFLFTTRDGTHPLRSNFARELRHAADRAGLDGRRITWLTLRHTGTSLIFDAGLTLFEVQQRLGHKDPTLTARVYTHLMRERFDEGRERLETYMADKRQNGSQPLPRA
jgi:integrase